jgi:hypothetical protein
MLYLSSTDCLQWPFVGGPFQDKGWFFHVDGDVIPESEKPFTDLYGAMTYAAARGYSHILFYDMGEVCEELPVFRAPESEEMDGVFYSESHKLRPPSPDTFQLLPQHIGSSAELYGVGAKAIRLQAASLLALLRRLASNIEDEAVPREAQNRADLLEEVEAQLLAVKPLFQAFNAGMVPRSEVI